MKSNLFELKEHDFPYDSFVGGWYIPEHICDGMLEYYYENINDVSAGVVNGDKGGPPKIENSIKDSLDLSISPKDTNNYTTAYRSYLDDCLTNYCEKYEFVDKNYFFNLNINYNIQKYKVGGGFKRWHFERSHPVGTTRILVFMTYLNDVEDGGTEFYYQKLQTPAKKGLTLIWPTDFTHTHKGIISQTKEKYIVTGWYTYTPPKEGEI